MQRMKVRGKSEEGLRQMPASTLAAFKPLIIALPSKQPLLYGFLVLKPGYSDNLMGNCSQPGDRTLVSPPIDLSPI